MPKDYKHIQPKQKKTSGSVQHHIKSFVSGLCIGLCVAVAVYFYQQNQQHKELIQPEITIDTTAPELEPSESTPPPTFDFYQILPNMEVNVSEYEAKDEEENMGEQTEHKGGNVDIYILQIGSFKQYEAADEVKAKLALMGISADIQRVVINGKDIRHRVRVGPYADSEKLSLVRQQLVENNLNYMLLKLKSEN